MARIRGRHDTAYKLTGLTPFLREFGATESRADSFAVEVRRREPDHPS
jgi:hypothetical protein